MNSDLEGHPLVRKGSIRTQRPFLRIFFEMREHYKNAVKLRTRGKVGVPELGRFTDIYIYLENIFFPPLLHENKTTKVLLKLWLKLKIMSLNFLGIL